MGGEAPRADSGAGGGRADAGQRGRPGDRRQLHPEAVLQQRRRQEDGTIRPESVRMGNEDGTIRPVSVRMGDEDGTIRPVSVPSPNHSEIYQHPMRK